MCTLMTDAAAAPGPRTGPEDGSLGGTLGEDIGMSMADATISLKQAFGE